MPFTILTDSAPCPSKSCWCLNLSIPRNIAGFSAASKAGEVFEEKKLRNACQSHSYRVLVYGGNGKYTLDTHSGNCHPFVVEYVYKLRVNSFTHSLCARVYRSEYYFFCLKFNHKTRNYVNAVLSHTYLLDLTSVGPIPIPSQNQATIYSSTSH